jgi:hypothetical protein
MGALRECLAIGPAPRIETGHSKNVASTAHSFQLALDSPPVSETDSMLCNVMLLQGSRLNVQFIALHLNRRLLSQGIHD